MYLYIEEESFICECLLTELYGLLNRFSLVQSFQLFVSLPENSYSTFLLSYHCLHIHHCLEINISGLVYIHTNLFNFFFNSRCISMHSWKKSFNTTRNEETSLLQCCIGVVVAVV